MIYLDNAATTQMTESVIEAVESAMQCDYGNPGTLYDIGKRAKELVQKARGQVAGRMNAEENQIIFTSGGSESNAMVFFGVADWMKNNGKNTVIVSAIEHESVLKSAKAVCDRNGFQLLELGVNRYGNADLKQLSEFLEKNAVGLVSIMYMNNEIGTENLSLPEIAVMCHKYGALLHTDCVQAFGCLKTDVRELKCDFLSVSSHKINGPKGVGALYAADKTILHPLIYGGDAQEFGLRGGTENVPGIVGFGVACAEIGGISFCDLSLAFWNAIYTSASEQGIEDRFYTNGYGIGKIISLTVEGVDNETLTLLLNSRSICVGTGSACNTKEIRVSHVLKAIGVSDEDAMSTIRISFSRHNTTAEAITAAHEIVKCAKLLLDSGSKEI